MECDAYGCDGNSWDEMATWIQEVYESWGWVADVQCDATGCTEALEGWGTNSYGWLYYIELYESEMNYNDYWTDFENYWTEDFYYGEFEFANYGVTCDTTGCMGSTWEDMAFWIHEVYEEWGWENTVTCDASGCFESLQGWGDNSYGWEYYVRDLGIDEMLHDEYSSSTEDDSESSESESAEEWYGEIDDECTWYHDDREGNTSEERCLNLEGCAYDAATDHCWRAAF